ncbi:MAG: hypothetical protein JKX98_12560 [Alcanivoracaceae bacterium]|nr:hypothetical protein [Alcanivoracaceae bacterium]MBL4774369.1 hypothetical protein [Alcanivoracaceae bacterium]
MQNNKHIIGTDVVIIGGDLSGSVAIKNVKDMLAFVVAGYAWDRKNPYVTKP